MPQNPSTFTANKMTKKHVICIQLHAQPELVNRIIRFFPPEQFDFLLHVDKKSGDEILAQLPTGSNIRLVERVDVQWGRFSLVEATLQLLQAAVAGGYRYIHLISGNCFPIKTPEEFLAFFNGTPMEYIDNHPLDKSNQWAWHGWDRYSVYYPQWVIHRPRHRFFRVLRICYREFIMRTRIFRRKKFPVRQFYGGSGWFSITGELAAWILQYLATHPEYTDFYRHALCGDEFFFNTLAMLSPYAGRVAGDPLRYMRWEGSVSGGPHNLTAEDIPAMVSSHNLFARKIVDLQTATAIEKALSQK